MGGGGSAADIDLDYFHALEETNRALRAEIEKLDSTAKENERLVRRGKSGCVEDSRLGQLLVLGKEGRKWVGC